MTRLTLVLLVGLSTSSCDPQPDSLGLVYVQGRAVEPVGDSLLAMSAEGVAGLMRYDLRTHTLDTIASNALVSPVHVQMHAGRWYVSDLVANEPAIVVLSWDGEVERRIDLSEISTSAHQFAVLPDGGIVFEGADSELLVLNGDSIEIFALVDTGMRPSLIAAVSGGVLHAVPDQHLTLFNQLGNIRWRVEWPWAETAYFTDIAVDRQGRIHMIAGVPGDNAFRVYTLGREDGDVIRWSEAGPYATFIVERKGAFRPDSASAWIGN